MGNKGGRVSILSSVVREGFTEKMTFKQRPEGGERQSHIDNWERVLCRRNNQCKDPEVGSHLPGILG